MLHEMKLRKIYFEKIKSGEKIYEIRLNDEKRKLIQIGDVITFKNEQNLSEIIQTKVLDLIYFKSFKEMAETLPLSKISFENSSKDEVEQVYHTFYSAKDENKYGVVAIKIELINKN